jgi:hypothetical protein
MWSNNKAERYHMPVNYRCRDDKIIKLLQYIIAERLPKVKNRPKYIQLQGLIEMPQLMNHFIPDLLYVVSAVVRKNLGQKTDLIDSVYLALYDRGPNGGKLSGHTDILTRMK